MVSSNKALLDFHQDNTFKNQICLFVIFVLKQPLTSFDRALKTDTFVSNKKLRFVSEH